MNEPAMILVINCGSSSIRAALFNAESLVVVGRFQIRGIGEAGATLACDGEISAVTCPDYTRAFACIWTAMDQTVKDWHRVVLVGHRVPHGGRQLQRATRIDDKVEQLIEALAPLAPLHNPPSLEAIRNARMRLGHCPHIAVFDTAFHATLPPRAREYALPRELVSKYNIQRYGFHGTSHQYVNERIALFLNAPTRQLRVISCHLGNGCSITAIENGRSIDTSMGMTPLEGLVMGSRCGDLDPGIIVQLLRDEGLGTSELDQLLNTRSGLRGIAGTQDVALIEQRASDGDESCQKALQLFCYRARKYVGAYAAVLGGIDAIVFTGGIGENSAYIRHCIAQGLDYLGVMLDDDRNRDAKLNAATDVLDISAMHSPVRVLVVATDEERAIASQGRQLLNASAFVESRHPIPIAVSASYARLCTKTVDQLFGPGYKLHKGRDLPQAGQFVAQETVSLVGSRGELKNVRIVGPVLAYDQVQISRSDGFVLGIDAPLRVPGDIDGSPGVKLIGPQNSKTLRQGVIRAMPCIQMQSADAQAFGVANGDRVQVAVDGCKSSLTFTEVLVCVSDSFKLQMHIDADQAHVSALNATDIDVLTPVSQRGRLQSKAGG